MAAEETAPIDRGGSLQISGAALHPHRTAACGQSSSWLIIHRELAVTVEATSVGVGVAIVSASLALLVRLTFDVDPGTPVVLTQDTLHRG